MRGTLPNIGNTCKQAGRLAPFVRRDWRLVEQQGDSSTLHVYKRSRKAYRRNHKNREGPLAEVESSKSERISPERISEAEHAVMEALWEHSPLTATDVCDRVCDARGWSLATVKTLLSRLVTKQARSEEHTSELQSLMRNSYAVLC